jgi:sugar phosphate isomerase/epimerase
VRLGVSGGPVPRLPSDVDPALAADLSGLGIRVLTTHFQPTPEDVGGEPARRVRAILAEYGISIVQATGYNPQLTAADDAILVGELARLHRAFGTARDLGAEMIISGCGSRHATHFYGPHPDNHAPATRERLIASLRRVVPFAEDTGVVLALECHVTTALDTPEHIREVLDAVDSPWVRANFDPVNLLGSFDAVWSNGPAMRHMWNVLGARYTRSAHIKDVVADPDLVVHISEAPPGDGFLDLDVFFEVCSSLGSDTAVIVEHLPADKARTAIEFVKQAARARGIVFA